MVIQTFLYLFLLMSVMAKKDPELQALHDEMKGKSNQFVIERLIENKLNGDTKGVQWIQTHYEKQIRSISEENLKDALRKTLNIGNGDNYVITATQMNQIKKIQNIFDPFDPTKTRLLKSKEGINLPLTWDTILRSYHKNRPNPPSLTKDNLFKGRDYAGFILKNAYRSADYHEMSLEKTIDPEKIATIQPDDFKRAFHDIFNIDQGKVDGIHYNQKELQFILNRLESNLESFKNQLPEGVRLDIPNDMIVEGLKKVSSPRMNGVHGVDPLHVSGQVPYQKSSTSLGEMMRGKAGKTAGAIALAAVLLGGTGYLLNANRPRPLPHPPSSILPPNNPMGNSPNGSPSPMQSNPMGQPLSQTGGILPPLNPRYPNGPGAGNGMKKQQPL